jgi:VIT1/CCC1 family predicted Fe2+/Mn2+ transporter
MRLPSAVHPEKHGSGSTSKLNWLRAGVLGANDGIVSNAALMVGVAGADVSTGTLLLTGVAGLLAGALSMAVGEYISVSSQRDAEKSLLAKERFELEHYPEAELEELTALYQKKGLSRPTAEQVANELTSHNAFAAHAEAELHIDPHDLVNPWQAGFASAVSFTIGALIPIIAVILSPVSTRVLATFAAVFVALVITGVSSANISGVPVSKVTARVVMGGILAMTITFGIGSLFGVSGI